MNKVKNLIEKLNNTRCLEKDEYEYIIKNYSDNDFLYAKELAKKKRFEYYENKVYIRALIEISNYCKNNCLYCGLRRDNKKCTRYRLTKEQILSCCKESYDLGFRTFVMQGGEDAYFTDDVMCDIIYDIKKKYSDCAITLSLGERSKESYKRLFDAGADRYLLRHETADKTHYMKLHPKEMSFEKRMDCLKTLKKIGYQVGCGFMVGSPYQTMETIAEDLKFIETFSPQMCGIGPFIPHHATPFKEESVGSVDFTLFLMSVIRLIKPNILLPATTALGSLEKDGRERGIKAGANVIMPNVSPMSERKKYEIYDNKAFSGNESALEIEKIKKEMAVIGYEIVTDRGDIRKEI
jgi:biotin synthase